MGTMGMTEETHQRACATLIPYDSYLEDERAYFTFISLQRFQIPLDTDHIELCPALLSRLEKSAGNLPAKLPER